MPIEDLQIVSVPVKSQDHGPRNFTSMASAGIFCPGRRGMMAGSMKGMILRASSLESHYCVSGWMWSSPDAGDSGNAVG
jgi:hypothetical protein